MKRRVLHIFLSLVGIVILRWGIANIVSQNAHAKWIQSNDFDPAIMFYTESKDVLRVEKKISRRIHQ